jgi:carbon monoxide dehydrogenase subunit G
MHEVTMKAELGAANLRYAAQGLLGCERRATVAAFRSSFCVEAQTMDMTGEYRIAAPRQRVWEALNDPDILKQCIPGCEKIEKLSPTELTATVRAKVGPVSARFGGKVTLSDLDPPNGYRISGEGTGGPAGFAKGGATVKLEDDGGATKLSYVVEANVGGKLAQIGSRLIDATARQMAGNFFAKFAEIVGAEAAPAAAAGAPPSAAAAPTPPSAKAPPPPPQAPSKRLSPALWVAILAAAVVLLLYFFTRG